MSELDLFDELKYRIVRDDKGAFYYNSANQYHRDYDLPAVTWSDGTREWWLNGVPHRDNDLPAFLYADGTQYWYVNGVRHRDNDMPAIVYSDGTEEWYVDGNFVK
jgi:hypothetical protein